MVLGKLVTKQTVSLDVSEMDKWGVIEHLVDLIAQCGKTSDRQAILSAVIERERRASTGLERGIAIPHARSERVVELAMALAISKKGIDFDSADGQPCHLVFLVVAPPQESTRYLDALSSVACIGTRPERLETLITAESPEEAVSILVEMNGVRARNNIQGTLNASAANQLRK